MKTTPDVVVIDASMALSWLFEREQPSDRERANRLLAACGEASWWIPGLWHLEVSNALLVAERLGAALASFDRQLNQVAAAIGVALFADP